MTRKLVRSLLRDEQGQGMAEYALILSLVAIACVTATKTLGNKVSASLTSTGSNMP